MTYQGDAGFLGILHAKMEIDVTQLDATKAQILAWEKSTTRKLNTVAQRIRTFGYLSTAVVTVPMIAAGKAMVKMASDYEYSMQKIVGLAGTAQSEINQLSRGIMALAPIVGRGPRELAEALYYIRSSGIRDIAQSMDVLTLASKASAAGMGETQQIARLLTSALNAYRGTGLTAAYATDVLTAGVREGTGEAKDFANALGQVIPIAANLQVPFDQVVGAMSAITLTGSSAANAAVYLKGMFNNLMKETEKGAKFLSDASYALNKMNLSYEDLRKILKEEGVMGLMEKLRLLTDAYGETLVAKVFPNIRSMTGALSLMGKNYEYNSELMQRVTKATGSLAVALASVSTTIKMRYDKAMSKIAISQILFGKTIAEGLLPILEWFARKLEKVAHWFDSLTESQKRNKLMWLAIIALMGPVSLYFSTLIYTISGLATVVCRLAAVLAGPLIKSLTSLVTFVKASLATSLGLAGAIGIVVVALAGLAYSIYRIVQSQKQLNQVDSERVRIDKIMSNAEGQVARQYAEEQAQLEVLTKTLSDSNTPLEVKQQLVREFNSRFGEYLSNLLTDKSTQEDIKKAYDEVNSSLIERIDLESKLAVAGALGEERASVIMRQLDLIRKRAEKMREMDQLQKEIDVTPIGGVGSKWGGVGLDKASQLKRDLYAANFNVKEYNTALAGTREELLLIDEKIKSIQELPGVGTLLFKKDKGPGGGTGTALSYYQELTKAIEEDTKALQNLSETEANSAEAARLRKSIDENQAKLDALMGRNMKSLKADAKDYYNTRELLAEATARKLIQKEEDLQSRLVEIQIQAKQEEIDVETDPTHKKYLQAQKELMIVNEVNRKKKEASDKLFDYKEKQYELEAGIAKQNAELTIADSETLARKIESIEIDKERRILLAREALYQEDITHEMEMLDIREKANSQAYYDTLNSLARQLAAYNETFAGKKALLDKDFETGRIGQEQYNADMRQLIIDIYNFKNKTAAESLKFIKGLTDQERNKVIQTLEYLVATAKTIAEKAKFQDILDQAIDLKRMDNTLERVKTFGEIMTQSLKSIGDRLAQGAESWEDYRDTAVNAIKDVITAIIKETIVKLISQMAEAAGIPTGGLGGLLVLGFSHLIGGYIAGAFATALNTGDIKIPGLAGEGSVYGPSLVLAGEYPGASQNPEHFIRDSTLRGLINTSGERYIAETEISARKLRILLKREDAYQNRGR